MAETQAEKTKQANAAYRNTAYTLNAQLYVGLKDAAGTELVAGSSPGYARKAISFAAPSNIANNKISLSNSAQVDFNPNSGGSNWTEAAQFGIYDALTAGNEINGDFFRVANSEFAFTGADTGDVITSYGHGYVNGDRVVLNVHGASALPTGLSANTIYFVVGATTDTFQLSATSGGAAIAITANGEGLCCKVITRTVAPGDNAKINAGELVIIK